MPQDRLDLLRSVFKAIETADVEVVLNVMTDDIVIDASRRIVDPVEYVGHDGVRSYARFLAQAWRSQRVEPEEFIEAADRVVIAVRLVSTGRSSGVTVDARSTWVATFREDKIARLCAYQTRVDALAAVGLGDG
jgi:ketosteroid isomerase-like protein